MSKITIITQDPPYVTRHFLPLVPISIALRYWYGYILVILFIQVFESLFDCLLLLCRGAYDFVIASAFSLTGLDGGDGACVWDVCPTWLSGAGWEASREDFYERHDEFVEDV